MIDKIRIGVGIASLVAMVGILICAVLIIIINIWRR